MNIAATATVDLMRALEFVAHKHSDHRRKGAAGEPYVNHLAEVARLLADATEGSDLVLVLGGLLHDAVEDTEATLDDIEREFGREVAALVSEVTDDKSLPKAEQRRRQVEGAPNKSKRAKMIKLADKTSNLRAMLASPPVGWDEARRREYLVFSAAVIEGCRGVNESLEAGFDEAYQAAVAALG
jgi:(p)ppGpp synthase/HD superfamily hydrolase